MAYNYESQEKALRYLIEKAPHDMEKFQKLYNVETEGNIKAEIKLHDILFSDVWTAEEKKQLIKLYGYNDEQNYHYREWTYKTYERDVGYSIGIEGLPLVDECIKNKNYTGLEALLSLGAHISVATIPRIIDYIEDPKERYKFCKLIVNYYGNTENIQAYSGTGNQCYLTAIPTLCDRYPVYSKYYRDELSRTVSSMEDICSTNDLKLVKLFLATVKNINPLFMYAVKSQNIEMVKLFIEAGADVNYQDTEFARNQDGLFKTPLKIAIDNNDLAMVEFLHQHGANLNYVDKSQRIQEFIANLGEDESEKRIHQYTDIDDNHDYIVWANTPLEYAIKLGAATINSQNLIKNDLTNKKDSIEKQFRDRLDIVMYLYKNGAKFSDAQINYTDLICFAINSDDYDAPRYFFEEALQKDSKLDFVEIIRSIHEPGIVTINNSFSTEVRHYNEQQEGANPWFRQCEEYSEKLDKENNNRNIKLMLKKIFNEFSQNSFKFNKYKSVIKDFSNSLSKEDLKDIPAIFGVSIDNLEEVLSLGYNINSIYNGQNIVMYYIENEEINTEILHKLISLGADINYKNHRNGASALSSIMLKLPKYDDWSTFGPKIFDYETKQFNASPEEYEKEIKSLVKEIIDLSNPEIIQSKSLRKNVASGIKPGYSQIIYNEILKALAEKGFKINDEYITESIQFADEYVNPWEYLWNLYSNFTNNIKTYHQFPEIEAAKKIKHDTEQSNKLLALISEHLKRNFVTSVDEIPKLSKAELNNVQYTSDGTQFESKTILQCAQDRLLKEIARYIGHLDYHLIMILIDSYPIIDAASINRSELLEVAMKKKDTNLCIELMKRGVTIACYDEKGHDVTSEKYSAEQIAYFQFLNNEFITNQKSENNNAEYATDNQTSIQEYNPNKECEDLLAEIGCENITLSKKWQPKGVI